MRIQVSNERQFDSRIFVLLHHHVELQAGVDVWQLLASIQIFCTEADKAIFAAASASQCCAGWNGW